MGCPTELARGAAAAGVLFLLYALTASPSVGWLDGGELTAAAWELGVSHPPGQPLPTLLWRALMLLPVGSIAFRATLFSAVCAAATALPLAWIAGRLCRGIAEPLRRWIVPVTVIAALLGFATWTQAVRAEVYALQLLLALGVLATAWAHAEGADTGPAGFPRARAGVAMIGLLGLSGATHPLLAAGLLPVALAALVWGGRRGWRDLLAGGALAGAGALSAYLYLPLRTRAHPELAWGMPGTPARFLETISGHAFAHNFSPAEGGVLGANAVVLSRLLVQDAGLALLGLALAGAVWMWWARRRGPLLLLGLALAGNLATVAMQNKVYASNPDLHGYLALTVVVLALCASAALLRGLDWIARRGSPRVARIAAPALVAALLVAAVPVGLRVDRSRNYLPEQWSRGQLDPPPPGAVVVLSGTSSSFVSWYLQRVERRRPDLVVFRRLLLGHEFHERHLRERHGDPPAGVDTVALRGDAGEALASGRPVYVELREPDLAHADRLVPGGRLALLSPHAGAALPPRPGGPWTMPVEDPGFLRDGEALQLTLYDDLLRAAVYRERGRDDLVERQLREVQRYAPDFEGPLPEPADPSWWRQR